MRMPDLPRRTALMLGAIAIFVGLVIIAVAAIAGSGSSSNAGSDSRSSRSVKPVAPIDPKDKDAVKPPKESDVDVGDPFANSFGTKKKHKIRIQVTANGYVNLGVYYRDRKKPKLMAVNGFQETRTITSRYPIAAVTMQLPGNLPGGASVARCSLEIDDIEVASKTTRKKGAVKACFG